MTPLFQLNHVELSSAAGSLSILQDISLEIRPGELLGLVGPSGSGKSSLLRLLNRLQDRTAGELMFQGHPVEQIPVLELRRQVVLVGQESDLLNMTVSEALRYPLELRNLSESAIKQRLQTWIDRLQLPLDWLQRSALELSVGQRQRIAVARGLLTEPQVLLLDEPTASQDIGQAERLLHQLQLFVADRQAAIVMANHQLEWVRDFCHRVVYLHRGKLAGTWPVEAVEWGRLRQEIAAAEQREQDEWGD